MEKDQNTELQLLTKKYNQLEERIKKLETTTKTEYATPKELATILNCSLNNIYIKIRNGKIKAVPIGRSYRIPMQQFSITTQNESLKNKIFI